MTTHRPPLRVHAELMVIACPLNCVAAAADEQAARDVAKVLGSRVDQPGEALLCHSGTSGTAPVTCETSKSNPTVPSTMMPCSDLIAPPPKKHATHKRKLLDTLMDGMVLGDMLRHSCCHHMTPTSIATSGTPPP